MPFKDPEVRRIYARKYNRAHRLRNLEKARAYGREFMRKNYEKYQPTRREYQRIFARKYRKLHRDKHAAYWTVKTALKRGKLIRPLACEKCHEATKLQAHHHKGYAKEFWLDVVWLCHPCHRAEHTTDNAPYAPRLHRRKQDDLPHSSTKEIGERLPSPSSIFEDTLDIPTLVLS